MSANSIGKGIENLKDEERPEGLTSQFFTVEQVRNFKPLLCFLNGKDRDILYLVFVSRKKQKEVQSILGRSQPSLCYDIKRIRRRLRFIAYLNSVFDIFMEFIHLRAGDFSPEEMETLTMMFYTSSFTQAAEVMGVSHVRIRYVYDKCIRRMEEMELWDVYEIFTVIRANLNIVRRRCRGNSLHMREIFFPV